MSYCRFSSENFDCDVYVYGDVHGRWITSVAHNRLTDRGPKKIGLKYDGKTYSDPTPGTCADRLEKIRAGGYTVPQYAIDALRLEQKDMEVAP